MQGSMFLAILEIILVWVGISLLSIPLFKVFFSLGRSLILFPTGSSWPIVSRLKNVDPGTPTRSNRFLASY